MLVAPSTWSLPLQLKYTKMMTIQELQTRQKHTRMKSLWYHNTSPPALLHHPPVDTFTESSIQPASTSSPCRSLPSIFFLDRARAR